MDRQGVAQRAGEAAGPARLALPLEEGGPAGGVLSGTYPDPGFAEDMATQAELAAHTGQLDAHGAAAVATAPGGERTATELDAGLAELDHRLRGLLSASPDLLQDHAHLYDDFFGGHTTSGLVGALGWTVETTGGGTLAAATSTIDGAPGWYALQTGSTTTTGVTALALGPPTLRGHPVLIWEERVSWPSVNGGGQHATTRVGLTDRTTTQPDNGYWFELTSADTSLHCRTAKATARSDVDSGVVPVAGRWYRLRIVSDGGGVAYFLVDGALVATIRSPLPGDSAAEAFGPTTAIAKTAGTGTSRALRVDYCYLLHSQR